MNKQLELVKEFQEAFNQPVLSKEEDISIERRKLRLSLLFEELSELAESYGVLNTFNKNCIEQLNKKKKQIGIGFGFNEYDIPEDTNILNKVEVLDATGDLAYILAGTILENGQQEVFDQAFEDIHNSNMSKLCKNMDEAQETANKYKKENIDTYPKTLGNNYIGVFRNFDNKILKNINYKPVDLKKYI